MRDVRPIVQTPTCGGGRATLTAQGAKEVERDRLLFDGERPQGAVLKSEPETLLLARGDVAGAGAARFC